MIEFFRHTVQSQNNEEEKLDEHLQPIPSDLHGAVTRTSPELMRHYESLGMKKTDSFHGQKFYESFPAHY